MTFWYILSRVLEEWRIEYGCSEYWYDEIFAKKLSRDTYSIDSDFLSFGNSDKKMLRSSRKKDVLTNM